MQAAVELDTRWDGKEQAYASWMELQDRRQIVQQFLGSSH